MKRLYFSIKFCLLVTVALDIFIKKNNTLYLPWISPLLFFYAKGVYSVKVSGKVPFSNPPPPTPPIFRPPPDIPTPRFLYFTQISNPLLIRPPPTSHPPFIRDFRVVTRSSLERTYIAFTLQ